MSYTGIGPISAMQGSCGTEVAWRRWSLANDEETDSLVAADLLLPTCFRWGEGERELLFCRHRVVILPRALYAMQGTPHFLICPEPYVNAVTLC